MKKRILEDPAEFIRVFFPWFPLSWFHKEWLEFVEKSERSLVIAPRCHGKTTVLSIFYVIFKLAQDFTRRIKVLSCSDERARDIVFGILRSIRSAGLEEKGMKLLKRKTSRRRIYIQHKKVVKDASVEAMGILSMTEGARADIVICDDVVSARNSTTPGLRQMVKDAFYNCVTNMVEPTGKIVYVATIWHAEDLTSELLSSGNFSMKMYSIDEDFNPLWPEVWDREKLVQRYREIGQRRFDLGFRNIPIKEKETVFDLESVELCKVQVPDREVVAKRIQSGEWKTFMGVDLAVAGKGFNAICVIAVDSASRRWLLLMQRNKSSAPSIVRLIAHFYQVYKPLAIFIESNAYQKSCVEWAQELVKDLPIRGFTTGVEKHSLQTGVRSLATEVKKGLWCFPKVEHDVVCKCGFCVFYREMMGFPFYLSDDCVMSWWLAREAYRQTSKSTPSISIWEY